jgi:predicted kinase
MCGIGGAGKTVYAQRLEADGYVRLSIDEEVWRRFGRYGIDYELDRYAEHSATAEEALERQLLCLVADGRDVVADFSFRQRAARERYRRLVRAGRCSLRRDLSQGRRRHAAPTPVSPEHAI